MALVLIFNILIITVIYLLINMAYLEVLGLEGMAASNAVGVDMMRATLGERGGIDRRIGFSIRTDILKHYHFHGSTFQLRAGKRFSPPRFLGKVEWS